jgi:hypothetical protein
VKNLSANATNYLVDGMPIGVKARQFREDAYHQAIFASNFVVSRVVQRGVLEFAQRCNDWKTYSGSITKTSWGLLRAL